MPTPDQNPGLSPAELVRVLRGIGVDIIRYLQLKAELGTLEGKEAGLKVARAFSVGTLAACFIALSSLFACAALTKIIADLLSWRWEYVALVFALLHFGGAVYCALQARSCIMQGFFTETVNQLKKDREWLQAEDQTES
jgi:uncharacterized membrane protein YqjE